MWQGYIRSWLLGLVMVVVSCAVMAQEYFTEGVDYTKLPANIRENEDVAQTIASDPDKVQVLFFFSYGCHGCEIFHGPFGKWVAQQMKKPDNKVVVYQYPVSFNQQWKMLAKLYYVMDVLDPDHKLNTPIFEAIHKKGLKLWQESGMQKFFIQNGYTEKQFKDAYNSFSVNRMVKRADELSKVYNIVVTPDIIINGPNASYKLDLSKVGNSTPRLIETLNYLVARESKLIAK